MRISFRRLAWQISLRRLSQLAQFSREEFRPVIGLEVHVQLNTKTKLFSRASSNDDALPNNQVASFDMATPGTLPVLNKSCVMHAIRMAILLNCEIPSRCRFDRKHYFYADMPAGYQITQSDQPLARNGRFVFSVYSEDIPWYDKEAHMRGAIMVTDYKLKSLVCLNEVSLRTTNHFLFMRQQSVRVTQLQLEQDSGKTIHFGQSSLIDLNRAGAPLVEIVTEPDFSTALEAMCFVQQLRLLLMHHDICRGEMHKGHLRVDANVSLSHNGSKGVRTEVKNINSLRHLHTAINFEINRQYEVISSGNRVVNETRTCDEHGRTMPMRDKEEITDYRFIPEPNLPFLKIRPEWLTECAASMSSEPSYIKYQRFGFEPRRAVYYAEDPALSQFVDLCAHRLKNIGSKEFVTWMNELKLIMLKAKAPYPPLDPEFANQFMAIVEFYVLGRVTKLRAIETLKAFLHNVQVAEQFFNENNFWRITDEIVIDKMVKEVLARNKKLLEKASTGHAKSLTRLRALLIEESEKRLGVEEAENAIKARLLNLKDLSR